MVELVAQRLGLHAGRVVHAEQLAEGELVGNQPPIRQERRQVAHLHQIDMLQAPRTGIRAAR